jgi:hypothetical protein
MGISKARALTANGLFYDNLLEMARCCREEEDPLKLLAAFTLNHVFMTLALNLGDDPVIQSELREMEAKYRTAINLALEAAISGAPCEEQHRYLRDLILLLWRR